MRALLSQLLWGNRAKAILLFSATFILLLSCLGARELWTQEHRWADIVSHMFYTNDFLHPWLNGRPYYDKPLLSYWLISGLTLFMGKLSTWSLRLPSALAGITAVYSMVNLGKHLKNRELGLLAGWMLLTTWYFLFWARTSSADMLNMAGTLGAVSWYFSAKSRPGFVSYFIFYLIIALTALCKGLIAPAVVGLVVLPDLLSKSEWRKHIRFSLILAAIPALILYFLPFWASAQTGTDTYHQNGLTLVWQENILRYFKPFDHKGPVYTYLIYLPVYLLPWTLFFIPALGSFKKRLMHWPILLLFIFFTLSGSRRNYYILPVVPFALLLTADWILEKGKNALRYRLAGFMATTAFTLFFLLFAVLQPLYYRANSLESFANHLRTEAEKIRPWSQWQVVLLDPESKVRFYLALNPETPLHEIPGNDRASMQESTLREIFTPIIHATDNKHTIYVSRLGWKPALTHILQSQYQIVQNNPTILRRNDTTRPVAFIPSQ